MPINVNPGSYLRYADLLETANIVYWDKVDFPDIPRTNKDLQYQVRASDRVDSLSVQFYGDPVLQWVIALANGFELLPTNLIVGSVITIPDPEYVRSVLLNTYR